MRKNGFTLIEIMIALLIFALLAIMAATGLFAVIKSRDITTRHINSLLKLQIAMVIIERDAEQIVNRPITDNQGNLLPALVLKNNQIEFTRAGLMNPFGTYQRSSLQRVAYFYKNHQFIRETWAHLDRAPNSLPTKRVLLNNINGLSILVLGSNQQIYNSWPILENTGGQVIALPKGIEITLQLKHSGNINRVFVVNSVGISFQ